MTVPAPALPHHEPIPDFDAFGVRAFVTTRAAGTFDLSACEPVRDVLGRWFAVRDALAPVAPRFATARQVHGTRVVRYGTEWEGWLRVDAADAHASVHRGIAFAITIADCVPVFVAHPSGAIALLHAGWRGVAGGILRHGVAALVEEDLAAADLHVHFGPAICGRCYEVGPDVYARLTGQSAAEPATVDLRDVLLTQARSLGVRHAVASDVCTRCHNGRFFSHRAGDAGRQIGVIVAAL